VFPATNVITERAFGNGFKTYFVGFDLDNDGNRAYEWERLIDALSSKIPEFAFGHHLGTSTDNNLMVDKIRKAAKAIYRIPEFEAVRELYTNGGSIKDDDAANNYLRRGEFGELILHLLLTDYNNTIPLLAKIYFKDSNNETVHGFDAVHIQPSTQTLWLGESKLYFDGRKGIDSLISDIKTHFERDYLAEEFTLILKKIYPYEKIPEKETWVKLLNRSKQLSEVLQNVTIPLLCTYNSDNFSKYDDTAIQSFIDDYDREVVGLKEYFDKRNNHPWKTNLSIILLLFPVKCKKELVSRLHNRLYHMQRI
jgi:hypothetical protein